MEQWLNKMNFFLFFFPSVFSRQAHTGLETENLKSYLQLLRSGTKACAAQLFWHFVAAVVVLCCLSARSGTQGLVFAKQDKLSTSELHHQPLRMQNTRIKSMLCLSAWFSHSCHIAWQWFFYPTGFKFWWCLDDILSQSKTAERETDRQRNRDKISCQDALFWVCIHILFKT